MGKWGVDEGEAMERIGWCCGGVIAVTITLILPSNQQNHIFFHFMKVILKLCGSQHPRDSHTGCLLR